MKHDGSVSLKVYSHRNFNNRIEGKEKVSPHLSNNDADYLFHRPYFHMHENLHGLRKNLLSFIWWKILA